MSSPRKVFLNNWKHVTIRKLQSDAKTPRILEVASYGKHNRVLYLLGCSVQEQEIGRKRKGGSL